MKVGRNEREVISLIMGLKLIDEKKHQKELKERRNREKETWRLEIEGIRQYKRLTSLLNNEARKYRKIERTNYNQKFLHQKNIRQKDEERQLTECHTEINEYKEILVFNRGKWRR